MTVYTFTDAIKTPSWARVALVGPPGSGKKFSALRLAAGFGGVTGVVDTERDGSSKYAHLFTFRALPMHKFGPVNLIEACAVAADQGIDNLIISTLSSFWSGQDGMLEAVDRATAAAGGRDKGAGWNAMRPVERDMTAALLDFPGNVLVTLRTKIEWLTERDDQTGMIVTRQVGTKPDQRDGITYDFDTVLSMDAGTAMVTKSSFPELTGRIVRHPGEDLAEDISKYLSDGAVGEPFNPVHVRDWAMSDERTRDELLARFYELQKTPSRAAAVVLDRGQVTTLETLVKRRGQELKQRDIELSSPPLGAALVGAAA